MKAKLRLAPSVLLIVFLMLPGISAAQRRHQSAHYTVTDLGTLGGDYSFAYGLNNVGVVAGGAATNSQTDFFSQTGFVWYRGQIINIGTLGGADCPDCSSEAGGPNAAGLSPVLSETATFDANGEDFCGFGTKRQCLAAVWKNGNLRALPTIAGGNNSQAYWANNQGEIVGFSETDVFDATCSYPSQVLRYEGVVWGPNGIKRELRPYANDTVSFGFGINDQGQAIGVSGLCSNVSFPPNYPPAGPHAVLWQKDGSVVNLGGLDTLSNVAASINNRGDVVGTSEMSDGTIHSFLWTPKTGTPQDLGTYPSDSFVTVTGCCHTINDKGEIVGFSINSDGMRALVWQSGTPVDLNSLLPEDSSWYLLSAASINDVGQIVGWGINENGDLHAYLATPITTSAAPQARGKTQPPPLSEQVREFVRRRLRGHVENHH
jgi:probable HAF family extracellular repeat protein